MTVSVMTISVMARCTRPARAVPLSVMTVSVMTVLSDDRISDDRNSDYCFAPLTDEGVVLVLPVRVLVRARRAVVPPPLPREGESIDKIQATRVVPRARAHAGIWAMPPCGAAPGTGGRRPCGYLRD